jgi:N-acetylglucosaminyldiphosphoundecaprenol N-acetyl-beta-D-mannosaminyltransferase
VGGRPSAVAVAGASRRLNPQANASIFLLGGNPGTAERAAEELARYAPGVRIVGTMCPPFGFEADRVCLDRIAQNVRDAGPQIVFVGLGFPKQERLIAYLRQTMPHVWFVPCGVSFSFVAGEFQRAPKIVQRLGLEWVFRLIQEPRRLYRRYVLHGVPFAIRLLVGSLVQRVSEAGSAGHR